MAESMTTPLKTQSDFPRNPPPSPAEDVRRKLEDMFEPRPMPLVKSKVWSLPGSPVALPKSPHRAPLVRTDGQ